MTEPNTKLITAIKLKRLTQGALVRGAGLSSETRLSRLINGIDLPREDEVIRIATALGITPEETGFIATEEDSTDSEVADA